MSLVPRMFRGSVWITKDGQHLDPLNDMKASHLENTLLFIQKSDRLIHLKNMVIQEFLSLPSPNGEMAEIAYEESVREITDILESMPPKTYFEEHIEPSPLFQRLIQAYFKQTGKKSYPSPPLN